MQRLRGSLLVVALAFVPLLANHSPAPLKPAIKATPTASSGAWTTYHFNDGHTGYDPNTPTLSGVATGWTSAALDEEVYAEPLVYNGLVYAVTLNDSVYALNQATGAVVWHDVLGTPVSGGWTCGNISPQGIHSTPVIDAAAGRIYVTGFFNDDLYHVFALDLANGNALMNTALNSAALSIPNFDWRVEGQRGALALHNGYVYVPFGGRFGDCQGPYGYHGFVVGVPTNGSSNFVIYQTPNTGSGIWASGGPVVDDVTGNVFATTGNGDCNAGINQNDAVVRLSPTMALQDYFMPQDWQTPMCTQDLDLGGAGPLLISPNLLFQAGKSGGGYLLNPNNLGGVDGQLFPTPKPQPYVQADVCHGNTNDATFGSFAYAAPFTYVACDGNGLVALNTNTGAPSFTPCTSGSCGAPNWSAGGGTTFGPPIVAGGAVWAATDGGGLYAFDQSTGNQVFHSYNFNIHRFVTPAEAGGQVFVPSMNVIRSFNMTFLPWASVGGQSTSSPEASASSSTRSDVFVRGTDGGLWQNTWNGSTWGNWQPLGGGLSSAPGAVASGASRIDVFVRGTDNQLWQRTWNGASWALWQPQGGGLTSAPDADQWSAGAHTDVFVRGTDGQLWHKWAFGSTWQNWEPLGGGLSSDPASVAWGPDRVDVFVRGTDNQLWHRWYDKGTWYSWEPLGGVLLSGAGVASCAATHLDVFVVGTDGGLWRKTYNGSGWSQWTPLGGSWTADPSAVCLPGTTTLQVFERGTDNAIWFTPLAGT